MPIDPSITQAPASGPVYKTVIGDQMVDAPQQEQPPEHSVSFAPPSADAYELPELNDPTLAGPLRAGALDVGLSVAEVSIVAEQLAQVSLDSLTQDNCDRELGRMWGSPMEVERRMDLIAEAYGPQIQKHRELLEKTGLGNSPILITMLYNSAQRKLGRYSR